MTSCADPYGIATTCEHSQAVMRHFAGKYTAVVHVPGDTFLIAVETSAYVAVVFESLKSPRIPDRLMQGGKHIRLIVCPARRDLLSTLLAWVLCCHVTLEEQALMCSCWSVEPVSQEHMDSVRNTFVRWGGHNNVIGTLLGHNVAIPVHCVRSGVHGRGM